MRSLNFFRNRKQPTNCFPNQSSARETTMDCEEKRQPRIFHFFQRSGSSRSVSSAPPVSTTSPSLSQSHIVEDSTQQTLRSSPYFSLKRARADVEKSDHQTQKRERKRQRSGVDGEESSDYETGDVRSTFVDPSRRENKEKNQESLRQEPLKEKASSPVLLIPHNTIHSSSRPQRSCVTATLRQSSRSLLTRSSSNAIASRVPIESNDPVSSTSNPKKKRKLRQAEESSRTAGSDYSLVSTALFEFLKLRELGLHRPASPGSAIDLRRSAFVNQQLNDNPSLGLFHKQEVKVILQQGDVRFCFARMISSFRKSVDLRNPISENSSQTFRVYALDSLEESGRNLVLLAGEKGFLSLFDLGRTECGQPTANEDESEGEGENREQDSFDRDGEGDEPWQPVRRFSYAQGDRRRRLEMGRSRHFFFPTPKFLTPAFTDTIHSRWISSVQFVDHTDRPRFLSCSDDGSIALWRCEPKAFPSASGGRQEDSWSIHPVSRSYDLHEAGIYSMDVRGDKILTSAKDAKICLSSLTSTGMQLELGFNDLHSGVIKAVKWKDDNIFASCGNDRLINVVDIRSPKIPSIVFTDQHLLSINHINWNCNPSSSSLLSNLLISSSFDKTINVYDIRKPGAGALHIIRGFCDGPESRTNQIVRPSFFLEGYSLLVPRMQRSSFLHFDLSCGRDLTPVSSGGMPFTAIQPLSAASESLVGCFPGRKFVSILRPDFFSSDLIS